MLPGALALALQLIATARAAPPAVTGIDLVSPYRLPEDRVRAAIGNLTGVPLSREGVRTSIAHLWDLGLFSGIRVDEIPEAAGIRLRYVLTPRPLVGRVHWEGKTGIDVADLAALAGFATGEEASPERFERIRRELLARYHREGFLAASVQIKADPVPDTSERDVTVVLDSGERARIGDVEITGDTGIPMGNLTTWLDLRRGSPYGETRVREHVRAVQERLRGEGFYEARVTAGAPRWDPATNRVALTLTVAAGPRFRVELEGRSALSERALLPRLTFPLSGVVDLFEQQASARELEAVYHERGYAFARVEAVASPEDREAHILRFRIDEGPEVRVASVMFSGNHGVSSDRLRKAIETGQSSLFRPALFRQDTLDRDLLALATFLRSEGYPDAAAGPAQVTFSDDRRRAHVIIPIDEGPRVLVGAVTVEGERLFSGQEILAALPFKAGDPWDPKRVEDGQRAIERLYGDRGYGAATALLDTTRHDGLADVRYQIEEGQPTRIGRILVRGLVLTREDVVRRGLPFRLGDVLIPDQVLEGQRRLGELPAFASVSIDPLRPPPEPFADVDVTIRERKPWHIGFGVGYGNADGARGFLELGYDNVFGIGASASIRQQLSGGGQSTSFLERTDALGRVPLLFGSPWWLDLDLFQQRSSQLGYDLAEYGLLVGLHRDLWPERIKGLRGDFRYRIQSVTYSNVDPTLVVADVVPGTQVVASVTPALTLDRRDDRLDPKRGGLHLLSVETGAAPLGSDISFVKARLETSWFLDWLSPTVLVVAGRLGLATPFAGSTALSIQDRFFAGGATTIRGYREDKVGPLDARGNPTGGNALAILNLEWRFPIWRWFGGAVFVDTGTVTPLVRDLKIDAFRTGAGGGLSVRTPVGPIRIDVGYALSPIPGDSRTQVSFTVGNPF
jgi:outer membrane protein insertion porin family